MEIRFHTCGGSVETFFQDDPVLTARILKGIRSTKVFTGDNITFAGEYSVTTFIASRVIDAWPAHHLSRQREPVRIADTLD